MCWTARRGERALHLCFGNYGGQSIQSGFWANLLGFLNKLHVDHLVLEFARRGYDELEVFTDLREGVALGIGVIDIKDNEVESPDEVAPAHSARGRPAGRGAGQVDPPRLRLLDAAALGR